MKYRILKEEELKALEKEFIQFLVSNGITAEDWEKIKEDEEKKAIQLIEVFSDIVFEKLISKIEFLEYSDSESLRLFKAEKDKMTMLAIQTKGQSPHTLNRVKNFEFEELGNEDLQFYKKSAPYDQSKDKEIFKMTQAGCLITDHNLYSRLNKIYKEL